jgi:hypothetical protein
MYVNAGQTYSFSVAVLPSHFIQNCLIINGYVLQAHHKASVHASDVPHVLFDYHQECRGGNTKNLSKLKAKVEKYMKLFSLFYVKGDEVMR